MTEGAWVDGARAVELPSGYRWGRCLCSSDDRAVYALEGGGVPSVAKVRAMGRIAQPPLPDLAGMPHILLPGASLRTCIHGRDCVIEIMQRAEPCVAAVGSLSGVLNMLCDISEALMGLEVAGVQHNDIKPSNILYRRQCGFVLTDFEAATPVGYGGAFRLGSPGYASPEHMRGRATSPASDQYSLALSALRLLQLQGEGRWFWLWEWLRVRGFAPDTSHLPCGVGPVLMRAMRRTPRDRYSSAIEFHRAVAVCAGRCAEGDGNHG